MWVRPHGPNARSGRRGRQYRMTPQVMSLTWQQIIGLFVLAIPIACVARTVVLEDVFRELREVWQRKSKSGDSLLKRKFFYLLTCEYCFSHYVTLLFLILTPYKPMYDDWHGYLIAF